MLPSVKQLCAAAVLVVTITLGLHHLIGKAGEALTEVVGVPVTMVKTGAGALTATMTKLGRDLKDLLGFTPTISSGTQTIPGERAPIFELATTSRWYTITRTWKHRWAGSEKQVAVTATFLAKAGFDLKEAFDIRIDDDLVTVKMPRARVLSVEPTGGFQIEGSSGWWNRLTDEDRSEITRELIIEARRAAERDDIAGAARTHLRENLETIFRSRLGKDVRILYREG